MSCAPTQYQRGIMTAISALNDGCYIIEECWLLFPGRMFGTISGIMLATTSGYNTGSISAMDIRCQHSILAAISVYNVG